MPVLPSHVTRRAFLRSAAALAASSSILRTAYTQSYSADATAAPHATTLLEGWEFYHGDLGGIWEAWRGKAATENVAWHAVSMPHCFNMRDAVDPDVPYYQGPGWYRLRLPIHNPYPGGRTLLHFEGAGQKTQVYIGLSNVAEHIGGYDEFAVDITDAVAKAEAAAAKTGTAKPIELTVRCDNSRDLEMIPSSQSDFSLYGGLYRKLHLVYAPAVSVQALHIASSVTPGGPATATVKASLFNPTSLHDELTITLSVFSPDGKLLRKWEQTLAPWQDERELLHVDIPTPQLWSPDTPTLYRCEMTLVSAQGSVTVTERFGLRHAEFVKHGPFMLNGKRLLLQGTQRHEDHAGYAAAVPEEITRQEFRMIKDMGANFIRLGHYQQSRLVLDLCDELGLLVWEEIPWCRGGLGGTRYQQQAKDMLTHMISQHYNHPSVLMWGLGNENDWPGDFPTFDPARIRAFMQELNTLAHTLDPSRPTCIRRCEFCKDVVDVYSPTLWAGWYKGRYIDYAAMTREEMAKVDHFLHIEWGGDSHAQRHSEEPDRALARLELTKPQDQKTIDDLLTGGITNAAKNGDWSESYIVNLFDWHLKEQEKMPELTGSAQWCFKDFSTPLRPENPVPRVNQKGLVERDLTPKEGYYVFQSYWSQAAMAHIYGHSWPVRWGDVGEQKLVKVYSNCNQAELFVNNVSCGTRKRDSQQFPAAGLHWLVTFKPGDNHLKVVARKGFANVTDEVTFIYETRKWAAPARLELREAAREKDVVTLEARLLDAAGVQCLDSRELIRFGLTGDGQMLDNLGTTRGSRSLKLYNGRAVIRIAHATGESEVSVSAKGVPTALLKLRA